MTQQNKADFKVIPIAAKLRQPVLRNFTKQRYADETTVSVAVLDFSLLDGAAESPGYDPYNRPPPVEDRQPDR